MVKEDHIQGSTNHVHRIQHGENAEVFDTL